jgi:glucosyl-3-phosphoglycerate synthase
MADFHQPRFLPTVHHLGRHSLLGAHATDLLLTRAHSAGISTTLILPALAQELDTTAFPRMLRLLSAAPLVGRLIVVLGHATPDQQSAAARLLRQVRVPVSLVRLDDPTVPAITKSLARHGIDVQPHGKGHACWVGMCTALAGSGSDVIAMHDCDIETYTPVLLKRLLSPLVMPARPYDFAKGYYPRVTTRMYGRVTRLLVAPLLRALQTMDLPTKLPAFLADCRYPLAGEVAFSRALATDLPIHGGWGLEIGTLAEVYRRQGRFRACQVDIADDYDHRHRTIGGPVTDATGLTTMVEQILMTLMDALRRDGVAVDARMLRYVLIHHRHEVQRLLEAYEADAAVNGLAYDHTLEATTAEQFAAAFERCIANGLCAGAPVHPSWKDVQAAAPHAAERFAELAEASELDRAEDRIHATRFVAVGALPA